MLGEQWCPINSGLWVAMAIVETCVFHGTPDTTSSRVQVALGHSRRGRVAANPAMSAMPPKVCPTERGMGKHSAEAKSQRPDLLHPYLYRARNLVERFFNKSSNVGVS